MPGQQGRQPGDLFIVFSVVYPERLQVTDEFLEEIKKHLKTSADDQNSQHLIASHEYELMPLTDAEREKLPRSFRLYFPRR